jgi:hypothetical protein
LQRVTGNLKLKRDSWQGREHFRIQAALRTSSGVALLSNDEFAASADGSEGQTAEEAIDGLLREAGSKFATLPETPEVIILLNGLSATGTTRLSLYALNQAAFGSLDESRPCRITVMVGLADASGAMLDATEHSFEPEYPHPLEFVFEKGVKPYILGYVPRLRDVSAVRISPGLLAGLIEGDVGPEVHIFTSWTGDVYADIETEKLPQLKSLKLSVKWTGPNSGKTKTSQITEEGEEEHLKLANVPAPQPSSTPGEERTVNSETEDRPSPTESRASPDSTPQSLEVRRASTVAPEVPSAPRAIQDGEDDTFVNKVLHCISTHNGSGLTRYTVDKHVNYFGSPRLSNDFIEQDVNGAAHNQQVSKPLEIAHSYLFNKPVLNTQRFTHEVSNEYSAHWVGPMLYDSLDVQTEAGWVRFTVGYTVVEDRAAIYALVLKAQ